jgi:hypothetical protein
MYIQVVRMEHKIRTTVYLDRDVKRLVDEENLNLSKFVNENVLLTLCVDSEDDLINKKSELESKIKLIDGRISKLRTLDLEGGKLESTKKQIMDELRSAFKSRVKQDVDHSKNMAWITSPKNIARCKLLKEHPEEVLKGLEAWYDGTQAD